MTSPVKVSEPSKSVIKLRDRIEANRARLEPIRQHWEGRAPSAFLSADSRKALAGKLSRLAVNYVRLAVTAVAERLEVTGFTKGTEGAPDAWARWLAAGGPRVADLVHLDRALYGAAYVTVWGNKVPGQPVLLGDSPRSMALERNPVTGAIVRALRLWEQDETKYATVITPEAVTTYRAPESGGWKQISTDDNALGIVPVVPMLRATSLGDLAGTSVAAPILDLSAALEKVMTDALVASEYYAKPRRWATGLEITEDDEGNPVDPFGDSRLLQSESPETKFGQLGAADVDQYADMVQIITKQIGAMTGLPSHYLGLGADQPPNSESIRAAESQLVQRVIWEQRPLTTEWGRVAALIDMVSVGGSMPEAYQAVWASPELRTPGQTADAAAKLVGIGVPLASVLADPMRYTPAQIEAIMKARTTDLAALLRGA